MRYMDIGGQKISGMTLGTVQLGMDYGIANSTGKPSMEKAFEILDTAAKGGINSFDTANAYGDSEEVLGKYFSSSRCKMERPFIATKFKLDMPQETDRNSIERKIYSLAEKSMERLKINKIPVYMLHNAKEMSIYGEVVPETLKKLKNKGIIKKAGVSVYSIAEVEEMLKYELYEAVQIPMNIFDLRMVKSGVVNKLKKAGIIVFVRSVFLQGLFFLEPEKIPGSMALTAEHLKNLLMLARQERLSIAQLAISHIRDIEGVTSLVLGAETPQQVADNIRLMESPELSSETKVKIEELSGKVPIETIMNELISRGRQNRKA
jgi:aryl-alcohol dehydrogenase-like predicted oxidoreductase